jgi:RNA polymerase sigma factor (TIGR02999 family)
MAYTEEQARREITVLLKQAARKGQTALDEVLPLVYSELRKIARRHLSREGIGCEAPATALANEAYMRIRGQAQPQWESRAHFLAVASRVMRQILVDEAREKCAEARDSGPKESILDVGANSHSLDPIRWPYVAISRSLLHRLLTWAPTPSPTGC